jgi:cell division septum initiation protein DivIVA
MSRVDREAVAAELLELLDQVEAEEEAARESAKKHKERLGQLKGQAKEQRDILAGKRGVQLGLTATTAATLAEAGRVAKRKGGES